MNLEQLIRETDAMAYLNALKTALAELKSELSIIEENVEYVTLSTERVRKIARRMDNQYRALVKCTINNNQLKETEIDEDFKELMENG